MKEESRPDPDALLERLNRSQKSRGHLRIYLGAFPGVGKTYAMLNEGRRRKRYGEDVVVGYAESHGRPGTMEQLEGLEVLPRRRVEYRGLVVEELDVDAVLERRPAVVLVDELAHTNAPGSLREKRYEDVDVILDAGISVVTTLNVQHLESLNDTIEAITGIRVRETLPDSVLDQADEVILIDLTPEGARARMQHGNIYPPAQARQALDNFFKAENLAALRDLALKRAAQEADDELEDYMRESHLSSSAVERIAVLIDEAPVSRTLLRHAWRLAHGLSGELIVIYFRTSRTIEQRRQLVQVLELAEDLNGRICELTGRKDVQSLVAFLTAEGVNHLVIPAEERGGWKMPFSSSLASRLAYAAPSISLHIPAVTT